MSRLSALQERLLRTNPVVAESSKAKPTGRFEVIERPEAYELRARFGDHVGKEDFSLERTGPALRLRGNEGTPVADVDETLTLPPDASWNSISAEYKGGYLVVRVGRDPELAALVARLSTEEARDLNEQQASWARAAEEQPLQLDLMNPDSWDRFGQSIGLRVKSAAEPSGSCDDDGQSRRFDEREIEAWARVRESLKANGFASVPTWASDVLGGEASAIVDGLSDGIERLDRVGLPPILVLAFDAAWSALGRLARSLEPIHAGLRFTFEVEVECVGRGGGGTPVRRDRPDEPLYMKRSVHGLSHVIAQLALTAALPTTSCVYALPASADAGYYSNNASSSSSSSELELLVGKRLPSIRALPCDKGGCLLLSHRLIHWLSAHGGGSGGVARFMTIRLADPALEPPLLRQPPSAAGQAPPFNTRLALIALLLLASHHAQAVPPRLLPFALDALKRNAGALSDAALSYEAKIGARLQRNLCALRDEVAEQASAFARSSANEASGADRAAAVQQQSVITIASHIVHARGLPALPALRELAGADSSADEEDPHQQQQLQRDALPESAARVYAARSLSIASTSGQDANWPPIVDYGLRHTPPDETELLGGTLLSAEARERLAMLLCERAEAALQLGRECRALADGEAALILHPGPDAAIARAKSLLSFGACDAIQAVLAPYKNVSGPQAAEISWLLKAATEREANVPALVDRLLATSASDSTRLPAEAPYFGPMALKHLEGRKGRGLVASRRIPKGTVLLVERTVFPLAPPETPEHPVPLLEALARQLSQGGPRADVLRDLLGSMHPLSDDEEKVSRERRRAAISSATAKHALPQQALEAYEGAAIASIAAAHGLPKHTLEAYDLKISLNQMEMKHRVKGELVDAGAFKSYTRGLFPLASLLNHSCDANTQFFPLAGGLAMGVRAIQDIEEGEECTDTYIGLSTVGAHRRSKLEKTHGFWCACRRCSAPSGSILHRLECQGQALVCPLATEGSETHLLLPGDPYAGPILPGYWPADPSCRTKHLTREQAEVRLGEVRKRFEELHTRLAQGDALGGCEAAEKAESAAVKVLGPQHHLWMRWVSAAMGLTDAVDADDWAPAHEELLLKAYRRKEGLLLKPSYASDEDCFVRLNHALLVGVETAEGARLLREAFEVDALAHGRSVDGFVHRWLGSDFEEAEEEVRRVLAVV